MRTPPNTSKRNSPFLSIANDQEFYPGYYAPEESAFSLKEAIAAIGKIASGAGKAIGGVVTGGLGVATAAAPGLAPILPQLGIGSKSRIKEINAQAAANEKLLNLQMENLKLSEKAADERASDQRQLLVIASTMIFVVIILVFALRN